MPLSKRSEEIIKRYYNEAVQGLTETVLQDKELWYIRIANLPRHLQVAYTVMVLDNQIFNGGFHQYFLNTYGQFAFLTIRNLKDIKAHRAADILKRAVEQINIEGLTDDAFRRKVFDRELTRITEFDEALLDFLGDLDTEYELNMHTENVLELLADYLRIHGGTVSD